ALNNGSLNSDGDLVLTASGTLAHGNEKLTAGRDVSLTGQNISQDAASQINAARHITANARDTLSNQGQITAGQNLTVNSNSLTQSGKLLAGGSAQLNSGTLSNSGSVQGGSVAVTSTTLNNSGSLLSGNGLGINTRDFTQSGNTGAKGKAEITASGKVSNTGSLVSDDSLTLKARSVAQNGTLSGGKGLTVNAETLDSGHASVTHSDGAMVLNATATALDGEVSSGGDMLLQGDSISTAATAQVQSGKNLTIKARKATLAGTQAAQQSLAVNSSETVSHSGQSSAASVSLNAPQLNNSGVVVASSLSSQSQSLTNRGLMQGDASLLINTQSLNNQQDGTLYSAASLALDIPDISNSGLITSDNGLSLNATALTNPGKIIGSTLNVNAGTLTGEGLLQGANALTLAGGSLSQGAAGRWLTAGDLSVDGTTLTTAGTTQGQNLSLKAKDLNNSGSVLATGSLDAVLANSLLNDGELMSQGSMTFSAPTLTNHGSLLAAADMLLSGKSFSSSGTLQGNTLSLTQDSIANQGTLTGLNGLTLNSRGALANSGDLLSQRDLSVKATDVTNSGRLQGENITIDGSSLTNSGAIQSALGLALTLSGDMQAITGSKITALGDARIAGKALGNQGLVSAKTLAIQGDSLDNSGEISGVNGLGVTLSGNLQQQGKLLTGGKLAVKARDISNGGQLQGGDTQINAGSLTNSGRIQGDSGLTLTLLNALTSQAGGIILSQNALTITAPVLTSDGTIQGNGKTTLSATTQTRNGGKILSGGDLTLSTPDYSGAGWLQATNLLLDVATLESHGTVIAANQARLTGNSLTNGGTFQAAMLDVNYQAMSNSGTLLGNQSLTLKGNTLNNAGGKMFSGGDMLTDVTALSGAGQLVALGNLTLKLANSFSAQGVIASNKQLSVTSQGDITNAGTLQGKGITLNAKGKLSNNGQLTAGSGTTSLSGSQIAMNASGSLQAGGDVSLTSLGNITLDGFTGTAGSLVLTATGSLVNTALLYAGNNLSLFANSIKNLRGDILAGNNLVMQKDASGAANAEVSNRSGTIESQHGSVTVNTGSFYNGYTAFESQTTTTAGSSEGTLYPLPSSEYRFGVDEDGEYLMVLTSNRDEYRLLVGDKTTVTVSATGNAGRIASGGDLTITARDITNEASALLADGTVRLNAGTLNNMSYQAGTSATETVFTRDDSRRYVSGAYDWIGYRPTSQSTETPDGETYRAVILAGGNVILNVSQNLSNTDVTPWGEGTGGTQAAPSLNTAGNGSIGDVVSALSLEDGSDAAITAPDWQDTSDDASQAISGGTSLSPDGMDSSLYPLPSGNNGYFVPSTDPDSPYLITVNPKLDGLGQLDPSLFGDLYKLLGMDPGSAPTETSSRYTDINQFLGSSYMLGKLGFDPENAYRFLGDAAFDTRYVSNYVLNQTGTRYINGLGSDLDQMRYLMDSAADAQRGLGLTFGVALTADQVAALDHSILWWQTATINGQTVMVPKVYLSPKDTKVHNGSVISGDNVQLTGGNVTNTGSSLIAQNGLSIDSSNSISNLNAGLISAGGGLDLHAMGDISNISSAITGKTVQLESTGGSIISETLSRQNTMDLPGLRGQGVALTNTLQGNTATIQSQEGLVMSAGQDIHLKGAQTASGGEQLLIAGRDVTVESNQVRQGAETTGDNSWRGFSHETVANQNSTLTSGGNLNVVAGRDINSGGAGLAAEKSVGIQAGRDVNLSADGSSQRDFAHTRDKTVIDESVRQQGTEISSGGNTAIIAGRDVNSEAARVTASGDIGVAAGRDVNLTTATESDYHYKEQTKTKKGFLSSKTTHTIEEDSATREAGTLLSGDNVQVQAGNNLLVKGSSVVADNAVNLSAGNNVDIVAATNTDSSWRFKEVKKSGLMGTGGIGITVGSSKTTHDLREAGTTQSQSFSTVGSTGGSVVISAGNQAHIGGADLIAGKDLAVIGDSVLIDPGHDKRTRDETFEQKKSGLTLALSGTVGSAINNAVTSAQDTNEESDGRLKALQATKTALSGVQAGQAAEVASATGDPNAMGVSLSLTTQKSKSQQHAQSDAVSGSTLNAGNNLSVIATGKNKGEHSGDIAIAGSQLKAGGDTLLSADKDVILSGAANTQQTSGKNSSSGGGIGVSIGAGGGSAGISIFANVNAAKGKDKGNGTDWTETTIDSGNTVTINSGRDTVLDGAQVNGNKIIADVGRDLLMSSQQDNNDYDSKQTSVAAGGSFTFGSMTGSGYISANQDKMKSRFDSVAEQTGLYAGNGGFDITVGNHTQLDGAVIASTATADKNSLDTGTLGFSDLHNEADFKTEHSGISLSGGGSFGDNFQGNMPGGIIAVAGNSGHAEGTTQAAVADGTLTVRDKEGQQQDIANLSRDTEHANDSISPIFDKEKEQNRLKEIGLISDIGGQAADIARTQGELSAIKDAQEKMKSASPEDRANAKAQWEKANPGKTPTSDDINGQVYQNYYDKAFADSGMGTGGAVQRGIQAATAALQGLAGGNIGGALAGASAPELAHLLKSTEGDPAVNAIAHAILDGAVAAMQGNSAAAGAAGAGAGELAARAIAGIYYPGVKMSDLTEEQKQTVSTLASISAGMAGGIAGGDVSGAAAGASAGKNAVENNSLSDIAENQASGTSQAERYQKAQDGLKKATEEFKAKNCAGLSADACGAKMDAHRDELLAGFAEAGSDFIPVYGDIKSFQEADSALGYLAAVVGIMPGLGDEVGALMKGADKALKAGDLETASKLISKASDDVSSAKYFGQERKFWSSEPIEVKGNKVYQRNDLFDPNTVDSRGRTNIQRMEKGLAPLDSNGQSINLHHMLQKQDGPIAEVTQSFHTDNRSVIHINDNSIPSGIDRNEFNKWRSDYWKQRANDFKQ
ncbi:hemagglutinin repeat-containing protein, partial [Enterobacteriaceae bacterium H11S18]|uniref:hemagglutinin repeat-containing protein n=1 Tax=Dryocola clanedunensis TaxID=2925396 RepID=UPI0022EFFF00